MGGLVSSLQELPDPSHETRERELQVSNLSQCHGCGQDFEDLKRCTACNRVFYCSKECQKRDFRKSGNHKQCCHPDLLSLAMDNIKRLPVDEKMRLNMTGQAHLIPNSQFSQTVAKVSCPSVADFIECANKEYALVRDKLYWRVPAEKAAQYPGNSQSDFVEDNRYGLDVGVASLCAAINMWPGVYTINSCSNLHAGTWIRNPLVQDFSEPAYYGSSPFVQFVSDDKEALNHIQAIIERHRSRGQNAEAM